jgi:hypothetical protein
MSGLLAEGKKNGPPLQPFVAPICEKKPLPPLVTGCDPRCRTVAPRVKCRSTAKKQRHEMAADETGATKQLLATRSPNRQRGHHM